MKGEISYEIPTYKNGEKRRMILKWTVGIWQLLRILPNCEIF
jgi:hypothetical protein